MECSQIPTADRWDEQPELREEYRRHLRSCLACRRRAFGQAPDALLFELRDSTLPEGFWTGFWESLEKKLPDSRAVEPYPASPFPHHASRVFRWAAVAALAALLALASRNIPQNTPLVPVSQAHPPVSRVEYPSWRMFRIPGQPTTFFNRTRTRRSSWSTTRTWNYEWKQSASIEARPRPAGRASVLLLFAVLSFSVLQAEEALLTKAFVVKFKKVDEVASLVNPLLSEKGAVTLQPSLHTVIVQDKETNLRQIEMAIAGFDVPPLSAEISIKLIRATKGSAQQPISDEIKSMAKIGDVLKFNEYSLLDTGTVQCQEGEISQLTLADSYQISFVPDVIQGGDGAIRLKSFQLRKHKKETKGHGPWVPVLSLTLNLRNGETLVLGASRF